MYCDDTLAAVQLTPLHAIPPRPHLNILTNAPALPPPTRAPSPHTDTPVDRVLHVHVDHGVLLSKLVPYRDPLAATPLHLLAMGSERGASFVSFIS